MNDLEQIKFKLKERIDDYRKEMYLANSDESSNILYYEGAIDSLNWVLQNLQDNKVEKPNEAWGDY